MNGLGKTELNILRDMVNDETLTLGAGGFYLTGRGGHTHVANWSFYRLLRDRCIEFAAKQTHVEIDTLVIVLTPRGRDAARD